jgi:hypothetical protein
VGGEEITNAVHDWTEKAPLRTSLNPSQFFSAFSSVGIGAARSRPRGRGARSRHSARYAVASRGGRVPKEPSLKIALRHQQVSLLDLFPRHVLHRDPRAPGRRDVASGFSFTPQRW